MTNREGQTIFEQYMPQVTADMFWTIERVRESLDVIREQFPPKIRPTEAKSSGSALVEFEVLSMKHESALQEKLGDVPESKLVAESPKHRHENDICWELQIVERCSCAFIELASA